jgi:hypothetical protein
MIGAGPTVPIPVRLAFADATAGLESLDGAVPVVASTGTLGASPDHLHALRERQEFTDSSLPMNQASRIRRSAAVTRLLRRVHQPGDQRRRLLLHRRDRVRVGVERDRDGGVSEALRDDLGMDASAKRQGGMRMA